MHRDRPFVAPTDVFLLYTPQSSSTSWAEMYIRARLLNRNPSSCSYLSLATGASDLHAKFVDYYDLTGVPAKIGQVVLGIVGDRDPNAGIRGLRIFSPGPACRCWKSL